MFLAFVLLLGACHISVRDDPAPVPPPPPIVRIATIARSEPRLPDPVPEVVVDDDDEVAIDSDDIADVTDRCPDEPEDHEGYEDIDGCPDVDHSGDPVP